LNDFSVPPEDWPLADRTALERALTPDYDGSGECGQASQLRKATIEGYTLTYGQWLDFLARTEALSEADGPGDRVTPKRVTAWRHESKLGGLAPTSRRQRLANLGAILRLLVPNRDWSFVIRPGNLPLKRAIRGGPKPSIVRDVADVLVHVRQLHRQGITVLDGREKWMALRDAALLAVLLTRAPRVGSLTSMTMDRHIALRPDDTWHFWFPGEHTKNGRVLDFPLDAECSRLLTDYLEHARTHFPGAAASDCLWMGMRGPMTQDGLWRIAKCRTLAWFGRADGPHVFRKWFRASAARRSPELVMDAADVMGHTVEVSLQHYSESSGLHAALRHGERLTERRAHHAGRAERAFAVEKARWEEESNL